MSYFNFESMVTELTRLDAPLNNAPPMKWRRKASSTSQGAFLERLLTPSKLNAKSPGRGLGENPKTPRTAKTPRSFKTPGKTPSKTPGKSQGLKGRWKTPHKSPTKPSASCQDRFIPSRTAMDIDKAHFLVMGTEGNEDGENGAMIPAKAAYNQHISDAFNVNQPEMKILSYKENKPKPQEGYMNNLKVIYSTNKVHTAPKPKAPHPIPQIPERILDAPDLLDDYYLNLLDWSSNNHLVVALGTSVYIWNASSGGIVQLMSLEEPEQYVSCVNWIKEGNFLAVGTSAGNVELWDVGEQKRVRNMTGHASRVGALSWYSYICSSGSRTGSIHHHDVRVPDHHVGTLTNHTQEICGLSWSPDGRYLASGGNDNVLNIWAPNMVHDQQPSLTFTEHQAAVKALAWCPWYPNILASGGGTADRHIRLWNVSGGFPVSAVDTQSQVCAILWSKEYKELVSGHGFSMNQLAIWKYPSMEKVAEIHGHTARILSLTMSPDGTSVASAAGDETIRIWKCFPVNERKKSTSVKPVKETGNFGMIQSALIR